MTATAVEMRDAGLAFGKRSLWSGLDLDIGAGEFIAVLGPNGSGKSSLLKVLLGQLSLSAGSVRFPALQHRRRGPAIGYIPQQGTTEEAPAVRGVDLVGLGLDGHRWGLGLRGKRERDRRVAEAVRAVGATPFAEQPITRLSGGERQRLRVAQALVGEPSVLLCDEPLLSLDVTHQGVVGELIERRRRSAGTAVVFVTHEINPVLPYVDRVLYLHDGDFRVGTPDEVMNSATLSSLYGTKIEVVRLAGQIHVAGAHVALCEDEPHHVEERVL
ncbi:ATP-binding cassette domain-containing protein [Haloechinothrix sp. YIM 98757]|uniref:ATP-binding cassette domain-containing protein n=1 Tax=Haloechinothrix aidingensis TaxID=2752311 RepID=A0A838AFB5_9PSEU|nr:ATP-binding cassette domain-containing protein [Haloechinothrix aidingensis]MBA0127845.1 ATP-binding cassette domain-containing protein [Haloechinothrix aidingensis]